MAKRICRFAINRTSEKIIEFDEWISTSLGRGGCQGSLQWLKALQPDH